MTERDLQSVQPNQCSMQSHLVELSQVGNLSDASLKLIDAPVPSLQLRRKRLLANTLKGQMSQQRLDRTYIDRQRRKKRPLPRTLRQKSQVILDNELILLRTGLLAFGFCGLAWIVLSVLNYIFQVHLK